MLRAIIIATSLMLGINFAHACSKERWNQLYMGAHDAQSRVEDTDREKDAVGYGRAVESFKSWSQALRMCGAERTTGDIN
jgi:hypothetical protein